MIQSSAVFAFESPPRYETLSHCLKDKWILDRSLLHTCVSGLNLHGANLQVHGHINWVEVIENRYMVDWSLAYQASFVNLIEHSIPDEFSIQSDVIVLHLTTSPSRPR
jgi:hypothetical protein